MAPCVLLLGCVSYSLTPTPGKTASAKPGACTFEVNASRPSGELEELATISVVSATSSPEKFMSSVREDVCRVGGEIVVTEVNGIGQIVRGVVYRRR